MLNQSSSGRPSRRGGRQTARDLHKVQGRGGIQKRNLTPARVDKDGDLDMDSSKPSRANETHGRRGPAIRGAAPGRGRQNTPEALQNRTSNRTSRPGLEGSALQRVVLGGKSAADGRSNERLSRARNLDTSLTRSTETIKVWGVKESKASQNARGGLNDLISFIERKAHFDRSRPLHVAQSHFEGDVAVLKVKADSVDKIKHLDGYQFAGATLKVEHVADPIKDTKDQAPASQTLDVLKSFLDRRYNSQTKLLDLSSLGSDPELNKLGMFNTTSTESKFFPALMKVCDNSFGTVKAKDEAILSVSLANNALSDLRSVTTLASTLPQIHNLDISGNAFKSLETLQVWRWKLRKLDHLIVTGNPFETTETTTYASDLKRWYPALRFINNQQVRSDEEVAAATRDFLPLPMLGPNFQDEASIGKTFIENFFPAYDTTREALAQGYYDSHSRFSLSVNTSSPRDAAQPALPWDSYIKRSRSLAKLTHTTAQMSRLHIGTKSIAQAFSSLPQTRHPDLTSEGHKWCLECHTVPGLPDPTGQAPGGVGGLIVTTHGEFSEINDSTGQPRGIRSFDRTFTLGPGSGPGGIRIVNDILVLRAYGGHAAWKPDQSAHYGATNSNSGKTEEQIAKENMALQLSAATNMTVEYSVMCLEQSGWDLEGAAITFEQAKGNLPPQAFIQK